jgi:putative DNA primase/helicase
MNAAEIAAALHGHRSGQWWRVPCPVHRSNSETLALRDGHSQLLVKCWAGCDPRDVLAELARLGLLEDDLLSPSSLLSQPLMDGVERQRRIANALDLFNGGRLAAGSFVERYLFGRGIDIAIPDTIRASFGWLHHRESGERRPAMLGLVEHVEHGPVAVHVTYLAIDGSCKATVDPNRKFFGPVKGGAVRLGSPVRTDQWLVIGEGIESTASAMQLWGLPCGWAALSQGGVRHLVLPPEAQRIVIAVDNDENGIGQAAARDAAWIWTEAGRTVRAMVPPRMPSQSKTDFNDILNGVY